MPRKALRGLTGWGKYNHNPDIKSFHDLFNVDLKPSFPKPKIQDNRSGRMVIVCNPHRRKYFDLWTNDYSIAGMFKFICIHWRIEFRESTKFFECTLPVDLFPFRIPIRKPAHHKSLMNLKQYRIAEKHEEYK